MLMSHLHRMCSPLNPVLSYLITETAAALELCENLANVAFFNLGKREKMCSVNCKHMYITKKIVEAVNIKMDLSSQK